MVYTWWNSVWTTNKKSHQIVCLWLCWRLEYKVCFHLPMIFQDKIWVDALQAMSCFPYQPVPLQTLLSGTSIVIILFYFILILFYFSSILRKINSIRWLLAFWNVLICCVFGSLSNNITSATQIVSEKPPRWSSDVIICYYKHAFHLWFTTRNNTHILYNLNPPKLILNYSLTICSMLITFFRKQNNSCQNDVGLRTLHNYTSYSKWSVLFHIELPYGSASQCGCVATRNAGRGRVDFPSRLCVLSMCTVYAVLKNI